MSLRSLTGDRECTTPFRVVDGDIEIGNRHDTRAALRPLHQQHRLAVEVVAYPHIFQLLGLAEAIEVEVVGAASIQLIGLDNSIGGALYRAAMAQGAHEAPHQGSLARAEIAVQVKGKIKARIKVAADADQATMEAVALADPTVQKAIEGREIRRIIVVPGRLVNVIA